MFLFGDSIEQNIKFKEDFKILESTGESFGDYELILRDDNLLSFFINDLSTDFYNNLKKCPQEYYLNSFLQPEEYDDLDLRNFGYLFSVDSIFKNVIEYIKNMYSLSNLYEKKNNMSLRGNLKNISLFENTNSITEEVV